MKTSSKLIIMLSIAFCVQSTIAQSLIDSDDNDWTAGSTGATTHYGTYGDADQSSRVNITGPHGTQVVAWQASPSASNGKGGFAHEGIVLSHGLSHRFSVWIKSDGVHNCTNFFGYGVRDANGNYISTSEDLNGNVVQYPNFFSSALANGKWYLVVGFIHYDGYQTYGFSSKGAVYDPDDIDPANPGATPTPIFTNTDYIFPPGLQNPEIEIRSHLYSCAAGESMHLYDPRIYAFGAADYPTIAELLTGGQSQSDTEAPSPPLGPIGSNITTSSVDLSWNASTDNVGVTGYNIYKDGNLEVNNIGSPYTVTSLTASNIYSFTVTALDAAGNESAASEAVPVITGASPGGGYWLQSGSTVYYDNGDVGIGTNSVPSGYKLAVDGHIRTREIRVDQDTWSDYVFKKDYDLPTLEEVEKHIQKKGHLINIPSAKEVEENGIQLGEMNKLLLEKIEELTLYVLELKKENKKGIDFEKRIKEIEEKLKPKQ